VGAIPHVAVVVTFEVDNDKKNPMGLMIWLIYLVVIWLTQIVHYPKGWPK